MTSSTLQSLRSGRERSKSFPHPYCQVVNKEPFLGEDARLFPHHVASFLPTNLFVHFCFQQFESLLMKRNTNRENKLVLNRAWHFRLHVANTT